MTPPKQSLCLKFFNVLGPGGGRKGRMASMVFHSWNQIREKDCVRLFQSHRPDYLDGGQFGDFIYVQDVAQVVEVFANRP
jgi:ADP-L-glycero-D-manno-heptose 6-epimerase